MTFRSVPNLDKQEGGSLTKMATAVQGSATSGSDPESLLTKRSLYLSLKPPRSSPLGSAHHSLLTGRNPLHSRSIVEHPHHEAIYDDRKQEARSIFSHETLRLRLQDRLLYSHCVHPHRLPHPHIPQRPEIGDRVTRLLGVFFPLSWQNRFRDRGYFRIISDAIVTIMAPSVALTAPRTLARFYRLTCQVQNVRYGTHPRQTFDLYRCKERETKERGRLIVFVHGGAWGSGEPWFYRLLASSWNEHGYDVAILGYRVYPFGGIHEQVSDCQTASWFLQKLFPRERYRMTLVGHSSGAHIALLALVRHALVFSVKDHTSWRPRQLLFDSFIGLSGVFDIEKHFDYEAARGVEEISPMKPVNGCNRQAFRNNSPPHVLQSLLTRISPDQESDFFSTALPKHFLFVHGIEDATVPFTATSEVARILRRCGVASKGALDELYIAGAGHSDTIIQLICDGKAQSAVTEWLNKIDLLEAPTRHDTQCYLNARSEMSSARTRLVISSKL